MQRRLILAISVGAGVWLGVNGASAQTQPPSNAGQRSSVGRPARPNRAARPRPAATPRDRLSLLRLPLPLRSRLALTAEQQATLDKLAAEWRGEQRGRTRPTPTPGTTRLTPEQRREAARQREQHRAAFEQRAMAVLKPEQRREYEVMQRDARDFSGLGRPFLALLAVKDKTPDQHAQLKQLAETTQRTRREAFRGKSLGATAAASKMRQLEADTLKSVRKILTAAQQKQFDSVYREVARDRSRTARPSTPRPQ